MTDALTPLRLATYNLCHLRVPGKKIYYDEGFSKTGYNSKLSSLSKTIVQLDADILALQEVWDHEALADLVALTEIDYEVLTPDDDGVMGNAILVRRDRNIAVKSFESIWEMPDGFALRSTNANGRSPDYDITIQVEKFSRPILRAVLELPNKKMLACYCAHLKSRRNTSIDKADRTTMRLQKENIGMVLSTGKRLAEAAGLRWLINHDLGMSFKSVALMGDFNDTPDSPVLSVLRGQERRLLTSVQTLGGMDTYTQVHQKVHELCFDHILVSDQFGNQEGAAWKLQSCEVLNEPLHTKSESQKFLSSDHAPVVAEFSLR